MNKEKKAIESLKNYLGRDKQGLDLLDGVSRSVREVRKNLAKASEDVQVKSDISRDAIAERDEARRDVLSLREQLAFAKSQSAKHKRESSALEKELDKATALIGIYERDVEAPVRSEDAARAGLNLPKDSDYVINIPEFMGMFNGLKKEMKFAPTATRIDGAVAYELFGIIKDFSTSEMIKLGRFVASIAVASCFENGTPAVATEFKLRGNTALGKVMSEKQCAKFIRWFSDNIYYSPIEKNVLENTYDDPSLPAS